MKVIFIKQKLAKLMANYRLIFAYLMAICYLCTHYFVAFSQFQNSSEYQSSNLQFGQVIDSNLYIKSTRPSILLKKLTKNNQIKIFRTHKLNNKTNSTRISAIKFDGPRLYLTPNKQLKHKYNLKNKTNFYSSQILQDKILMSLLNTTYFSGLNASYGGVFVEAGAYDGETWSNTLYLERFKNWTGLLIEPSTENYKTLRSKNRNSYSVNSCLCAGKTSVNSSYIEAGPFGITTNSSTSSSSSSTSFSPIYSITCHPLANIFDAFFNQFKSLRNRNSKISQATNENGAPVVIDYMSLDIEGKEMETIKTFPWDKYRFNFLNIEYNQNKDVYKLMKNYLKQYGYVETVVDDVWYQDVYFAHESIHEKLNHNFKTVSQFVSSKI